MLKMVDLAGADSARRFSPYCWRIRLALAHKGLEVETIPWRFTEMAVLARSGQPFDLGRVPVLGDAQDPAILRRRRAAVRGLRAAWGVPVGALYQPVSIAGHR